MGLTLMKGCYMSVITLAAAGYRLTLTPDFGASWLSASWQHPDGQDVALILPLVDPREGLNAGNFIMAPFTNRICDGDFSFEGHAYHTEVNHPHEGMAIHGNARDQAWQVISQGPDQVELCLTYSGPGPWQYELRQRLRLSPAGIEAHLTLNNLGARPMPFGMGYHPWFERTAKAQISFASKGAHRQDARALPLVQTDPIAGLDAASVQPLESLAPLDHCFSDWEPQRAVITWPEYHTQLTMTAEGALKHFQLYVPPGKPLFCAEPVSHLPDVINRPQLGQKAAMTTLAPGKSFSGSMTLTARNAATVA